MTPRAQDKPSYLRHEAVAARVAAIAVARAGPTLLCAAVLLGAVVLPSTTATASSPPTVDTAPNSMFGPVLTTSNGFTLYVLLSDRNGISSCTGSCVPIWPALTVPNGTTPTGGPGVTGVLRAVMQPNGTDQVTYNGSPLYTFAGDSAPGQVNGNGVQDFYVATVGGCTGGVAQCITSSASAAATVGSPFTFQVTTAGTPPPKVKEKGRLPKGVKFHKGVGTAMISGTPTSTKHRSAAGTYHLIITATFGKGAAKHAVIQDLTLTVT